MNSYQSSNLIVTEFTFLSANVRTERRWKGPKTEANPKLEQPEPFDLAQTGNPQLWVRRLKWKQPRQAFDVCLILEEM